MARQTWHSKHIAILDNPENGQPLPALAVIEEFIRLGFRVTYVTSAEIASRLALLDTDGDSWHAVGVLDDSTEPASTIRGYFHDDEPDLMVYCTNTSAVAKRLLAEWQVPAAHMISGVHAWQWSSNENPLFTHVQGFLAHHGLSWVPHGDQDAGVLALALDRE
ncbi:hypothetical protein [Lentzea sp. HUAS12]|uniref:hypothetical protein n=1 Tax=Lentzea sp. HUAS12 TaxID=2951806 RepID=UPI00209F1172|nr:hypothetical protein [Lentzea sp. HUAS12]USX56249.1 hypothetical protein ND450_19750 [Lentzea sp. HUAS12]